MLLTASIAPSSADLKSCYDSLSFSEKSFMDLLNPSHQEVFCIRFNKIQKNEAMQLTGTLDTNGDPMTAEMAVELVAQNNSIIIPIVPSEPPGAPSLQPQH